MNRLTGGELRVAAVVALGGLLAVLDTTIVAVAMPRFMATFGVPLTAAQWIGTAYALGTVAVMPLAATVAARFGTRRAYLVALLAFAAASAAAGAAGGFGWLVAARAAQGLAGGLITPLGFGLAFGAVRPGLRARMTTVTGLPLLIGPLVGPVVGGVLADSVSWRALFLVTVPPALLAAAGVLRWVPPAPAAPGRRPVDVAGALLFVPGVVAVSYGLSVEAAGAGTRAALSLAGILAVATFVRRSWRHRAPLLNVRLLADTTFGRGAATLALYAAPYFGSMLVVPAYVQVIRGDTAMTSALLSIPGAVGMGLSVQLAARLLERLGPRVVVGTGLGLVLAAVAVNAVVLRTDTPYGLLAVLAAVQGVGSGAVMMPTIASASRNLHGTDLASGSAILPLVSTVASAVGTAGVSALFGALTAATTGGRTLAALRTHPGLAADAVTAYRLTLAGTLAVMAAALVVRLSTRPVQPSAAPTPVRSAP